MENNYKELKEYDENQEYKKRFASDLLKPKKGKYFYHIFATTISLFIITFLFTIQDYGKGYDFMQSFKLLGYIFVMVTVVWSLAYLYYKIRNKL
jgi:hypothetical protein